MKTPQVQKQTTNRRMTIYNRKQGQSANFKIGNMSQRKENPFEEDELHDAEKLIIYYSLNLLLFNEIDNALHLVQKYAIKIQGGDLYQANIYKVLGLIYLQKGDHDKAIEAFKTSKKKFQESKCCHGEALTRFAISHLLKHTQQEHHGFKQALKEKKIIKNLNKALSLLSDSNHLVGQAICHNQLAQMLWHKNDHKEEALYHQKHHLRLMKEYNNYNNKKQCPHIKRTSGPELSLMMEIVQSSDLKNLFPPPNYYTFKYKKSDTLADMVEEGGLDSEYSGYSFDVAFSQRTSLMHKADRPSLGEQDQDPFIMSGSKSLVSDRHSSMKQAQRIVDFDPSPFVKQQDSGSKANKNVKFDSKDEDSLLTDSNSMHELMQKWSAYGAGTNSSCKRLETVPEVTEQSMVDLSHDKKSFLLK